MYGAVPPVAVIVTVVVTAGLTIVPADADATNVDGCAIVPLTAAVQPFASVTV